MTGIQRATRRFKPRWNEPERCAAARLNETRTASALMSLEIGSGIKIWRTTMDAELKRKWVEALRSEKYLQGRGALRNGANEFCCLGVLCDVVGYEWPTRVEGYVGNYMLNPPQLRSYLLAHEATELVDMNDNGKSFAEIADYIEKHIEVTP